METNYDASGYPDANIILYGPPGTGKTFHTKNYALAALEDVPPQTFEATDREEINRRYQELAERGRIQFVTFHQSFSYEDFIEGIKPELSNEPAIEPNTGSATQRGGPAPGASQLRYALKDGLFKRMCVRATYAIHRANLALSKPSHEGSFRQRSFDDRYLAFLVEQMNLLKRRVEVSYPSRSGREVRLLSVNAKGNLLLSSGAGDHPYVVTRNKLRKLYQAYEHVGQIRRISTDITRVITSGHTTFYWAVFNELKEFEKLVEMDANPRFTDLERNEDEFEEVAEYAAMSRVVEHFDWSKVKPESLDRAERFVLIIDEINRGNVSQIFGELITLIEPDKRGGRPEALTVQLPYSKSPFTVPPNLYLIGTMNTTDRNVEPLDTALRRRFSFVEMRPDYALLEQLFGAGTVPDLGRMLRTINQRIARLLGREYAIGHAYLLSLPSAADTAGLKSIFERQLIPLLQEYFYGREEKVELVIGKAFFELSDGSTDRNKPFFADSSHEVQEDPADYRGHTFRKIQPMSDEEFLKAVVKIYTR